MKNIIRMSLVAGALVSSVAAQAQTAWTDKISLGGDLRFRLNNIKDEASASGDEEVTNNQIRARVSVSAKVNDAMTANFRLATFGGATNDYRSANHVNSTSNDDAGAVFELAYGDWRVMPGMVLSLGKAPNPYWQGGKNEMIWDSDLSFDGVTAKWTADMDTLKPFVNLAYTTLEQKQATTSAGGVNNVNHLGAQVGTSVGLGDTMNLTGAVGYLLFPNSSETTFGTALTDDYKLLDVTAELGLNMVANLPLGVYVDWATNQDAPVNDEDQAFLMGVKAGQFANVGSWEAWYNYREVQAQAVIPELTDSEFFGGAGVGIQGHQVGAGYMAWDNTTVGLNYWMAKNDAGADYTRYTADLIWKF